MVYAGELKKASHCMIGKTVDLVDRIEMHKTDCLERQDLSRKYLGRHELESVFINIIYLRKGLPS